MFFRKWLYLLQGSLEVKKDKTFWKSLVGDEVEGAEIVFSSLPVILKTIADNSGVSGEVVLEKVKSSNQELDIMLRLESMVIYLRRGS